MNHMMRRPVCQASVMGSTAAANTCYIANPPPLRMNMLPAVADPIDSDRSAPTQRSYEEVEASTPDEEEVSPVYASATSSPLSTSRTFCSAFDDYSSDEYSEVAAAAVLLSTIPEGETSDSSDDAGAFDWCYPFATSSTTSRYAMSESGGRRGSLSSNPPTPPVRKGTVERRQDGRWYVHCAASTPIGISKLS